VDTPGIVLSAAAAWNVQLRGARPAIPYGELGRVTAGSCPIWNSTLPRRTGVLQPMRVLPRVRRPRDRRTAVSQKRKDGALTHSIRIVLVLTALLALLIRPSIGSAIGRRQSERASHRVPLLYVTGYNNRGLTASGTWARPGICAVDPRYIPLGSYVRIPGVGFCHTEDTGGSVQGYHVDFWYPTVWECYHVTGYYRGAIWY